MARKIGKKPSQKMSAKTKKSVSPRSNIKVVPGDNIKRARKNVESTYVTMKAKSGATAKEKAAEVIRENKKSKTPKTVIKIRSGGAGFLGVPGSRSGAMRNR